MESVLTLSLQSETVNIKKQKTAILKLPTQIVCAYGKQKKPPPPPPPPPHHMLSKKYKSSILSLSFAVHKKVTELMIYTVLLVFCCMLCFYKSPFHTTSTSSWLLGSRPTLTRQVLSHASLCILCIALVRMCINWGYIGRKLASLNLQPVYPSNHYTKGGRLLVTEFFLTNALTSFHLGELSLACCQDNKSGNLATKLYSQINSYDVTSHIRGPPPSPLLYLTSLTVCQCVTVSVFSM